VRKRPPFIPSTDATKTLARAVPRKSMKIRRHAEREIARGDPNIHVNA